MQMLNKFFFVIGIVLLLLCLASLFILIPLLRAPMPASGKIRFTQPLFGMSLGEGNNPDFISHGSPYTDSESGGSLIIESEWPKQIEINSSNSISVVLTVPGTAIPGMAVPPGESLNYSGELPPIGDISNRESSRVVVNSLAHEAAYNEMTYRRCMKSVVPGSPKPQCDIENMFGNGYTVSAAASMVSTSFTVQAMGVEERATDQTLIEWDWNIFPKSVGLQVINVGIELRWIPIGQGGKATIVREIWEAPIFIQVNQPFFELGKISLSAFITGTFGVIFTGVSLPWLIGQVRQRPKSKKKEEVKSCRYCGRDNRKDALFCDHCGKPYTRSVAIYCSLGHANPSDQLFCEECGEPLAPAAVSIPPARTGNRYSPISRRRLNNTR